MVCPCCGKEVVGELIACACGAKSVGLPLTQPEWVAPKRGLAIASLIFALGGLLMFWITPLGLVALLGLVLARKSLRLQRTDAQRFTGRRFATAGLTVSILMLSIDLGLMASSVPKMIRNYHGRRYYSTVASMERLAGLLREYRNQYGTYPQEVSDLRLITPEPLSISDFWEQELRYTSSSLIAAKSRRLAPLTNFEIRSAGGDGEFGTADDIIMQDAHIIDPSDSNPALQEAAPIEPEANTATKSNKAGRRR